MSKDHGAGAHPTERGVGSYDALLALAGTMAGEHPDVARHKQRHLADLYAGKKMRWRTQFDPRGGVPQNATAEQHAREIAAATGESLTQVVAELQAFVRSQPDRDTRPPDEIRGYDEFGLPS